MCMLEGTPLVNPYLIPATCVGWPLETASLAGCGVEARPLIQAALRFLVRLHLSIRRRAVHPPLRSCSLWVFAMRWETRAVAGARVIAATPRSFVRKLRVTVADELGQRDVNADATGLSSVEEEVRQEVGTPAKGGDDFVVPDTPADAIADVAADGANVRPVSALLHDERSFGALNDSKRAGRNVCPVSLSRSMQQSVQQQSAHRVGAADVVACTPGGPLLSPSPYHRRVSQRSNSANERSASAKRKLDVDVGKGGKRLALGAVPSAADAFAARHLYTPAEQTILEEGAQKSSGICNIGSHEETMDVSIRRRQMRSQDALCLTTDL